MGAPWTPVLPPVHEGALENGGVIGNLHQGRDSECRIADSPDPTITRPGCTNAMSEKWRAEILTKRAKLEEMRKAEAEYCTSPVHALAAFPLTAGWITDLGFTGGAPPPKPDERDLDD